MHVQHSSKKGWLFFIGYQDNGRHSFAPLLPSGFARQLDNPAISIHDSSQALRREEAEFGQAENDGLLRWSVVLWAWALLHFRMRMDVREARCDWHPNRVQTVSQCSHVAPRSSCGEAHSTKQTCMQLFITYIYIRRASCKSSVVRSSRGFDHELEVLNATRSSQVDPLTQLQSCRTRGLLPPSGGVPPFAYLLGLDDRPSG
jgi:hypothetical protein